MGCNVSKRIRKTLKIKRLELQKAQYRGHYEFRDDTFRLKFRQRVWIETVQRQRLKCLGYVE